MNFQDLSFADAPLIKVTPPGPRSKEYLDHQSRHESLAVSYPKGMPIAFRRAKGATVLAELAAEESWARTDPKTAEMATVAEKFDSLVIHRSDRLFGLGMFVRMLDAQIAATGESLALLSAREAARAAFEARAADLEAELDYTVIPIQKLVRVQLGSALLGGKHRGRRQKRHGTCWTS